MQRSNIYFQLQHNICHSDGLNYVRQAPKGHCFPKQASSLSSPHSGLPQDTSTTSSDVKLNYSFTNYDPDVRRLLNNRQFEDATKLLNERKVQSCAKHSC